MLKLHRLGIALQPDEPQPYTAAKFNAGMTLDGDVVHMVYRYTEWRPNSIPATQSNYAVDETRYARLTPHGAVLFDSHRTLLKPSLPLDVSGCQDARMIPFEGAYYSVLLRLGQRHRAGRAGSARVGIARTDRLHHGREARFRRPLHLGQGRLHLPRAHQRQDRLRPPRRAEHPDRLLRLVRGVARPAQLGRLSAAGRGLDGLAGRVPLGVRQGGRQRPADPHRGRLAVDLPRRRDVLRSAVHLPRRRGPARRGRTRRG